MNRIFILLFIAVLTFIVVFFITNPDSFNEIWLYLIGFAGVIIQFFRTIKEKLIGLFHPALAPAGVAKSQSATLNFKDTARKDVAESSVQSPRPVEIKGVYDGVTLKVLRYSTKGSATYGLLYIEDSFLCNVIEDLERVNFVSDKIKIPAGTYGVRFREKLDDQTKEYLNAFPGLFSFHLELQDVKGFEGVLITMFKDLHDGLGAVAITNKTSQKTSELLSISGKESFQLLYQRVSAALKANRKVRIEIKDEEWISNIKSA